MDNNFGSHCMNAWWLWHSDSPSVSFCFWISITQFSLLQFRLRIIVKFPSWASLWIRNEFSKVYWSDTPESIFYMFKVHRPLLILLCGIKLCHNMIWRDCRKSCRDANIKWNEKSWKEHYMVFIMTWISALGNDTQHLPYFTECCWEENVQVRYWIWKLLIQGKYRKVHNICYMIRAILALQPQFQWGQDIV